MQKWGFRLVFLTLCVSLAWSADSATLTHRYSFDTDASDSIGAANGTLTGGAFITNGLVALNGSNSFVQLPNNLLTNYTATSLEIWFTDSGTNTVNSQLYNFTGTNGGVFYELDGRSIGNSNSLVQFVNLPAAAVGGTNHIIWTQDASSNFAALYLNGLLTSQVMNYTLDLTNIMSMTNSYLGGCGKIGSISNFNGGILEFRIYQGALLPLEAATLDASGPDQPQSDPGAPQDVRLVMPSTVGPGALFRAGVYADCASISNVNIGTQPDLILTSDHTNIIAIAPDLRLRTVTNGTATITALWQGLSNSLTVTVSTPRDIALVHRYGFNESTNDWIVHDSVGSAHGRLFNVGSFSPTNAIFTGHGEMVLSGGYAAASRIGGYATLPPGIISSLSEVTLEAWVTWTPPATLPLTYGYGAWQRIFDFGSQASGQGISYLFLTPATDNVSFTPKSLLHTAITTNLNVNENPRLNWTNALPTNALTQVVVAYSPVRHTMKMYVNGAVAAAGAAVIPLSGIVDTNCLLGKSPFLNDASFYGRFNEFRIYSGLLSDADVAADYTAGPDKVGVDFVLHTYSTGNSNGVNVTWGPSVTNLILQTSPALGAGAAWSPVSATATLQNGRNTVTIPATNPAAFFQLAPP